MAVLKFKVLLGIVPKVLIQMMALPHAALYDYYYYDYYLYNDNDYHCYYYYFRV